MLSGTKAGWFAPQMDEPTLVRSRATARKLEDKDHC